MKKKLKNFAYKLSEWLIRLYVIVTFLIIGIDLAFIVYYQFIEYVPEVVITSCASLFLMIYTNKEVRG